MSGKKGYHHGNLPETLLGLGLEAIESEGREGLSLRALAERAGVSKAAPYRHFADRDDFLSALANEGYRLLYEALRAAVPPKESEILPSLGRAYLAFALSRPSLYRLMTAPGVCVVDQGSAASVPGAPPSEPGWPRRALLFLAECLARDAARQVGEPVPSADSAAAAWAYIHGLVMLRIDELFPLDYGEPDWEFLAGTFPRLQSRRDPDSGLTGS